MAREFSILVIKISVPPMSIIWSMMTAIFERSTMELTATQLASSKLVIVGARLPGVILTALSSIDRSTLYVHSTKRWAARDRQYTG